MRFTMQKWPKDGSHARLATFSIRFPEEAFCIPIITFPQPCVRFVGFTVHRHRVSESSYPTFPKEAIGSLGQGVGSWSLLSHRQPK